MRITLDFLLRLDRCSCNFWFFSPVSMGAITEDGSLGGYVVRFGLLRLRRGAVVVFGLGNNFTLGHRQRREARGLARDPDLPLNATSSEDESGVYRKRRMSMIRYRFQIRDGVSGSRAIWQKVGAGEKR